MSITRQKITWECRIDGRIVPHVIEVTGSAGFEQINAEATIWCLERPSWADENRGATIWASNVDDSGQIFGGEVAGFDWTYAPTKIGIVCADLLARTREKWGGEDREYTDESAAAIIRNHLEIVAIASSDANIEESDILPNLGIIEPITLKESDTVYSNIQAIDELDGFRTFTNTAGKVLRRRVSGAPGPAGAITFSRGVEILSSPQHNRTRVGIVNRCIVTGLTYEGLQVGGPGVAEYSQANPYVTNVNGYITDSFQSNLIEDDVTALAIATRRVVDKNRRPESVTFRVPFDPRPQPAMTVVVEHPDLELSGSPMFVQTVSHSLSGSGAFTTITATGGPISPPVLLPPTAAFTVQVFLEGEDDGAGNVTAFYDVIADGSTSYDSDGTIAAYAWTASGTGATPAPTSGSESVFRCTVDAAATAIDITLTVTDNDGLTDALTISTPLSVSNVFVEDVYIAYGDVACSIDGQQTWRTATPAHGAATCLCPFAPAWGQLWGTDEGYLYATFDNLGTALVDLGHPHGAVACTAVWVHETDTTRLWAGFADGAVYAGALDIAGESATWTAKTTIGDSPVVELRESIGLLNELRATAGAGYYYSANGGGSWSLVDTGDTASRMAAGFDQNVYSFLNDAEPLRFEDGHSISLPALTPAVEHIRGLTFGWRTPTLYATDDQARLFTSPTPFDTLTDHTDTLPGIGNHMIRSGNADGVIYIAVGDGTGDNGLYKWIPDVLTPTLIRWTDADACLMAGYGAAHLPQVDALLLIPTNGTLSGGLWVGGSAGWQLRNTGLPAGAVYWRWISANPFNPENEWLLLGSVSVDATNTICDISSGAIVMAGTSDSPLWYTDDAGATWTAVSLTSPGGGTHANASLMTRAEWDDTRSGRWLLLTLNANTLDPEWFWGTAGSAGSGHTFATTLQSGYETLVGQDGDVIFQPSFDDQHTRYTTESGSSFTTPSGSAAPHQVRSTIASDRAPFTSRGFATNSWDSGDNLDTVYITDDYRARQPVARYSIGTNDGACSLSWGLDGLYITQGNATGINRVANPIVSTSAELVFDGGLAWGHIRADRRTRRKVATLYRAGTGTTIAYYDGTSWSTFVGPAGDGNNLANRIEVAA